MNSMTSSSIDYSQKIPNNVNLGGRPHAAARARAVAAELSSSWWDDVGPEGTHRSSEVYLRTATSVDPQGWATNSAT